MTVIDHGICSIKNTILLNFVARFEIGIPAMFMTCVILVKIFLENDNNCMNNAVKMGLRARTHAHGCPPRSLLYV